MKLFQIVKVTAVDRPTDRKPIPNYACEYQFRKIQINGPWWCGQAGNVPIFDSYDPNSNPAEDDDFSVTLCSENENKQKQAKDSQLHCSYQMKN